jgi:hypothetical protein
MIGCQDRRRGYHARIDDSKQFLGEHNRMASEDNGLQIKTMQNWRQHK